MTKSVKICIAVIVIIFAVAIVFSLVILDKSGSKFVSIVQDSEVIYKFDLSTAENQSIRIEDKNGGYNIVEISDGKIRISDADCPDKICVNTYSLPSA